MRLGLALTISLIALTWIFRPMAAETHGARFLSSDAWDTKGTDIGGLSAILMHPSGTQALVLSDRGLLFELTIGRGEGGIEAADIARRIPLSDPDAPIDSEGLARISETEVLISFELTPRVARLNTQTGAIDDLPLPLSFNSLAQNRGLEALALDDRGTLFTLAERPDNGFDIWRYDASGWDHPFTLPARDGFLAVSAEFGPEGRFYLLERKLTTLGFQSRLRRWDIINSTTRNEVTILTTRAGQFGNLEGLSLWQDAAGQMRATLVSDDNFMALMRTQLVEYALTE